MNLFKYKLYQIYIFIKYWIIQSLFNKFHLMLFWIMWIYLTLIIGNIYFQQWASWDRAGSIGRLFDRFTLSCSFGTTKLSEQELATMLLM